MQYSTVRIYHVGMCKLNQSKIIYGVEQVLLYYTPDVDP